MIVLAFDTETTGLIDNGTLPLDKQPECIEFAGTLVDLDSGEILNEFSTLIRSSRMPLPTVITKITGIKDADLADAPAFSAVAETIRAAIESAPAVLAHNASFDVEMVTQEFRRLGQTVTWPLILCTVEQSLFYSGFRLSLTALYELLFKEKFPEAHRAGGDVSALVRCAVEMRKRGDL